jgi:hypothetical protein
MQEAMTMTQEKALRENLLALLTGEHARTPFEEVLGNFPMDRINENFPNADYTPYALLEHLRRAQADILEYMVSADYRDKDWPGDFWPAKKYRATAADWDKSVAGFKKDFRALEDIVKSAKTDLFAEIPWGEGITYLREIVTVANHNAFHLGEFAMMRQAMGTWSQ